MQRNRIVTIKLKKDIDSTTKVLSKLTLADVKPAAKSHKPITLFPKLVKSDKKPDELKKKLYLNTSIFNLKHISKDDIHADFTTFTDVAKEFPLDGFKDDLIKKLDLLLRDEIKLNAGRTMSMRSVFNETHRSATKISYLSLEYYLNRIVTYAAMPQNSVESALITMWLYLKRYCKITCNLLHEKNVHRLILIALTLALKAEDFYFKNKWFAEVGGIPLKELNKLESEFLITLDYNIFLPANEINHYIRAFILSRQHSDIGQRLIKLGYEHPAPNQDMAALYYELERMCRSLDDAKKSCDSFLPKLGYF